MSLREEISNLPLVSVIIPTHNRESAVTRCVESVLRSNYANLEILIVDDGSTDGTFSRLSKFKGVTVIRLEQAQLVSAARNLGCKYAKGELVFLVDDDNVVHPDTVTELVKVISNNPDVGIAGPIMYYLEDPGQIWCSGVSRNYLTSTTRFSNSKPDYSTDCYPTEDIPNAFMVRKNVFEKVGHFDQDLFAQHMEEADFCQRATRNGYHVVMVPKATIWHDVPVRKWPYRGARNLHMSSNLRAYYVARNRILFMRKYAPPLRFLLFAVAFLPPIALSHIVMLLEESSNGEGRGAAGSYARGLIDGLRMIGSAKEDLAVAN